MVQVPLETPTTPTEKNTTIKGRHDRRWHWERIVLYAIVAIFSITSLGPFIFSFFSSFKTFSHILDFPPTLLPQPWTFDNFASLISNQLFPRWILNSFIVGVGVTVLNVLFSAMAGYSLSRLRFPGRNIIFTMTLAVMMIPLPVLLIPKFLIMNSLGLVNTYFAIILPTMAQPFSVFLMVQFMKGLPRELEESAMLDGATRLTICRRIILPLVKPALTAVAILSFQGAWNDFLWPLLTLDSQNMYTLPVGLFFFKNAHYTEYNLLIAGSMFNTIPMLILFFIFQRYFIEGVTSSAVKG